MQLKKEAKLSTTTGLNLEIVEYSYSDSFYSIAKNELLHDCNNQHRKKDVTKEPPSGMQQKTRFDCINPRPFVAT